MAAVLDENQYHEAIGRNMRRLREARQMSQVALAKESGVALRSISKLENGGGGLRLITAIRIANTLGVTLDDMVEVPA